MILPFQLSAQIEWEEMQPHNAASIIPILVTDDDRIYGKLEHSNKLFYSEDMAETWTLLYEGEFMDQRFPKGSLKVLKDDNDRGLWLLYRSNLYKFNDTSLDFELQIDASAGEWILDFAFLPNGNMILARSGNLEVRDENNEFVNSINWFTHHAQLIINKDEDRHYVIHGFGSNEFMTWFDSELNGVQELNTYPTPSENSSYKINNHVIYCDKGYTEDGMTWVAYENNLDGLFDISKEGNLYLFENNDLYYSTDRGKTMELINENVSFGYLNSSNFISSIKSNGIFINQDDCGEINNYLIDGPNNEPQNISNLFNVGHPHSSSVRAFDKDNLIASSCYFRDSTYLIHPSFEDWGTLYKYENTAYYILDDFEFTSNGNLISDGEYMSIDGGLDLYSWYQEMNPSSIIYLDGDLIYNNDSLYIIHGNKLYSSYNFGLDWNINVLENFFYVQNNQVIIASKFIFELDYDYQNGLTSIKKHNLAGELIEETVVDDITFESQIYSSFSGEEIFIITDDWTSGQELFMSADDGKTFQELNFPSLNNNYFNHLFHIDRLNNLFVVTDNIIYISRNLGQTWEDISPLNEDLIYVNDISLGYDNHLYLATTGTPILRSKNTVDNLDVNNENLTEEINAVRIIPNPAKDFFEIVSDQLNISSIQVFNSNGSAVKVYQNIHGRKNFRLDTSLYSPGIYFVEIQHENGEAAYKKVFIVD